MRSSCWRAESTACGLAVGMVMPAEALLQPVSSSGAAARQRAEASANGNLDRVEDNRAEKMRPEDDCGGRVIRTSLSIPRGWMRFPVDALPSGGSIGSE